MSDLISRSALIDSLMYCEELKGRRTVEAVVKTINDQPTVEAKPVVHGEWLDELGLHYPEFRCSKCGKANDDETDFCPNCGADMRKKVQDVF